ncbi:methyltransferase domain-containing protein [Miniphocaeibacter halophilus]|uniref:Methyltransferase domain-containing protein n=1 Tax=Miniphocaeibacter halophilus TaxID=2931922 RepID=A0AC61MTB3_9FIRM|nr:methyltransferase [Miniphocaeibacter halophilus]QQK08593.1 methyltransferase domain-containing protein [Miniphocaeibacter halophilus]
MSFAWTEEKIKLYKRASEFTLFNKGLAKKLIEIIGKERTIYDIGCGLSYLAMSLSEYSKRIYCIDTSKEVLQKLNKIILEKNITNIKTINTDYKKLLSKKKFVDCIIASHFLDMHNNLEFLTSRCNTLVIIKNTGKRKGLYDFKKQKIEDVEIILQDRKIDYKKFIYNGEFGQPLKSLKEAKEYYNSYSSIKIDENNIKRKLINIDNKKYPYYLPKYKNIGIVVIGR